MKRWEIKRKWRNKGKRKSKLLSKKKKKKKQPKRFSVLTFLRQKIALRKFKAK